MTVRSSGDRKAARTTTAKNVTPNGLAAWRAGPPARGRRGSTSTTGMGGAPTSSASVAIYFVSPA